MQPVRADARFRAMGSDAHVLLVDAPVHLLDHARERLEQLESLWSRFRPDSELCRINTAAGRWVTVSPCTVDLVALAVTAWSATSGRFDPTVLPALEAAGYTASFDRLAPEGTELGPALPAPGCSDVETDGSRVRIPPGVRLDLGGIGKGRAADLVAAELIALGAGGACVNVGGDLRVAGKAPDPAGWVVSLRDDGHEHPAGERSRVALADGAVTTSTRLRRRWRRQGQPQHHLIDPRTGRPSRSGIATVTVVAADAAWAEVLAKAALLSPLAEGMDLLSDHGVTGLIVTDDGAERRAPSWEMYERWIQTSGGWSPAPVA